MLSKSKVSVKRLMHVVKEKQSCRSKDSVHVAKGVVLNFAEFHLQVHVLGHEMRSSETKHHQLVGLRV